MSHSYYQALWKEAQNDLRKNLTFDAKVKKKGPYKDINTAKWLIGHLYMNYVRIVNKLDECYDQMIHPQKREVIGRLLDMCLGRILELKAEIVKIEFDDYCFFDNILIELKLTHQDMEIQVPKYFWRDREQAKKHRRKLMQKVFEEAEREKFRIEYLNKFPEEEREDAWAKFLALEEQQKLEKEKFEEQQRKMQIQSSKSKDSLEELKKELKKDKINETNEEEVTKAISLIQRHERARQGRIQALLALSYKKIKTMGENVVKIPVDVADRAAKVIQRHWRRYRKRVQETKAQKKVTEILGLTYNSFTDKIKYEMIEKVANLRRKMQERNQKEYEEALLSVKEKMIRLYTIPMEEGMVDEIRGWFQWFFEKCYYLPDYPPEKPVIPTGEIMGVPKKLGPEFIAKAFPPKKTKDQKQEQTSALAIALSGISAIGGSALVVAGHWIGPQEYAICQKELEKMKKAGKSAGNKEKKMSKEEKQALKKKLKDQERLKRLAEEALGYQLKDSSYLIPLKKADRDYRLNWMDLDESKNYDQRYIYDLIKDQKCWELSMEIRQVVDEMMVLELEILKDALETDKNPKKKKKKKKPPKKNKPKTKKGKKDPTGDRTLDDLFMELFRNGIIREYEEVHLKDYLGERSFSAFDLRQRDVEWPPSTGDVREVILQTCILPLGSWRIHQLSPLIKSVCLMGTEKSGKEFLARIICTETAAVMFDLTPTNVAGKYPGKDGLKMLQHLIEKMSRALQPSIIFVDGAEKTFYKKVPKEERELEPKRLAGVIQKVLKGIKQPDQILLLGVCSQPWMAKKKKFLKTYQKIVFVPQMDYGSYIRLWQSLLKSYQSIPRDFDVSCLAKVSYGFSVTTIMEAVKNVLTVERISRSLFEPFHPKEFLEELLKTKPADEKLKQKCLKFYESTELPKKRIKRLQEIREEKEKAKKKT